MAIANISKLVGAIQAARGIAASAGDASISSPLSETPRSTMITHGTGDIAKAVSAATSNNNSANNLVWGTNLWGSKTYKVGP